MWNHFRLLLILKQWQEKEDRVDGMKLIRICEIKRRTYTVTESDIQHGCLVLSLPLRKRVHFRPKQMTFLN